MYDIDIITYPFLLLILVIPFHLLDLYNQDSLEFQVFLVNLYLLQDPVDQADRDHLNPL